MKHTSLASAVFILLLSSCTASPQTTPDTAATSDLGKPCEGISTASADKGMECYSYGEAPDRKAIWIIPDVSSFDPNAHNFQSYTKNWLTYTSPDRSFSFRYPPQAVIDTENWKDNTIRVLEQKPEGDAGIGLTVERIDNNAVSINDRINQIKDESSQTVTTNVVINGINATRIDSAPQDSHNPGGMDIFISRNGYYLTLSANKYGNPYDDFFTEAVASTFIAK